jgi:hypothetical protein
MRQRTASTDFRMMAMKCLNFEEPHAYGVDTNWYPNTSATHHITRELNNSFVHDTYHGRDKVNTMSGQVWISVILVIQLCATHLKIFPFIMS